MEMKRRFLFGCLALAMGMVLCGCTGGEAQKTVQFFAMDTAMSVTVYGEQAEVGAVAVQQVVNGLEAALSTTRADSEIYALNAAAGMGAVPLSQDTVAALTLAGVVSAATDGAFDCTISPMMDAWGFPTESHHVPTEGALAALLPLVDWRAVALSEDTVSLPAGMAVDLGGIAKGYAGDKCAQTLAGMGITSALLDLGGNITGVGGHSDGSPWRVAVKDPNAPEDQVLCVISLLDQTASTSGGYQRYFTEDGVIYHHIIDPATGYPSERGLLSVTVVSPNGGQADALSTACFVMGEEKALALWRDPAGLPAEFELILCSDDGRVIVTEGLESSLTFEGEANGYTCEIARR